MGAQVRDSERQRACSLALTALTVRGSSRWQWEEVTAADFLHTCHLSGTSGNHPEQLLEISVDPNQETLLQPWQGEG